MIQYPPEMERHVKRLAELMAEGDPADAWPAVLAYLNAQGRPVKMLRPLAAAFERLHSTDAGAIRAQVHIWPHLEPTFRAIAEEWAP
jgi:hypothetical protein